MSKDDVRVLSRDILEVTEHFLVIVFVDKDNSVVSVVKHVNPGLFIKILQSCKLLL